jgi:uncharacterized membrane protein
MRFGSFILGTVVGSFLTAFFRRNPPAAGAAVKLAGESMNRVMGLAANKMMRTSSASRKEERSEEQNAAEAIVQVENIVNNDEQLKREVSEILNDSEHGHR